MSEKTFESILEKFKEGFEKVAKDVLHDIIGDYLPYAESDQAVNVLWRTEDWLNAFFAGKTKVDGVDCPVLNKYDGKKARELIYQEHKDEITALIGKDKENEIESLKAQLKEAWKIRV